MKRRLNIKGETLAETIVALSILAIGITMAGTVIMNSMRNLSNAKNRVVAVNIAREGVEAVRGIRDTNWLLYSDKRRQCWNHDPSMGVCDGDGTDLIVPGTYIVYKHAPEGSWRLQLADANPLLELDPDLDEDFIVDNDLDLVSLSLVDIDDSNLDSDGDGDPANDTDFYNHMNVTPDVKDPFGTEVKSTAFSRYIVIEYLENQPDITSSPSGDDPPEDSINTLDEWGDVGNLDTLNRMRVTSVVTWTNRGIPYGVDLKTILTDHLGREDLGS